MDNYSSRNKFLNRIKIMINNYKLIHGRGTDLYLLENSIKEPKLFLSVVRIFACSYSPE